MHLPVEALIAREKLSGYLLVKQVRNDKSQFLAIAGYSTGNAQQLENDLRSQILTKPAVLGRNTKYGQFYEVTGALTGPNGTAVEVKTVWMTEHLSGTTKFITLVPQSQR